ncbi:GumC family protein [Granulicella tundricola]|uniref:Lipopolysaccharide biosynthesis protein n=1 Tax=Granulicella tundricola (strain ATCC BAA-1859 / DSM 23138 / MP5ACTX9) TaxID=1198114 RepID=E8X6T1_GRATM|nr:Wzz/FepE/Etk N-terminal domain-containing protein [Granulicella tundricola]ADW71231.1 lipopolysaccharide biosynthesis protein [Granulicella tundricola MP5ACTX9]
MQNDSRLRLRQILMEAVFRRQRLWWTVFVGILVLTVLVIVFLPKRYEATAKLVVANLRTRSTLSAGPVNRIVTTEDVSQTQINSEVDLLKSQAVVRAALGLPNIPVGDPRQLKAEQETVKRIQDHLSIDPVRDSSIIDVRLIDKTPEMSVFHLTSILESYLNQRKVLTQSANAADFFDRQAQLFSGDLANARDALTKFEEGHELVDMDEQKKLQIERVAAIEDQIAAAKSNVANQTSRTRNLLQRLASTPARTETVRRSLTNQYSQERLNTNLVELVNRRDELLHRYPPTDRAVLALDQNIATARSALDEAALHPASDSSTDVNPIWQQVTTSLVTSSAEVSGSSAAQKELERQHGVAEGRLHDLQQSTQAYDVLKRRYQEAQTGYNLYVQKRDEARVGEALDKDQLFDVTLVQRPITSIIPVRPKPLAYAVAGLLMALILASVLALYADSSDLLVYTPQQLDAVTGVRTSGTLAEEINGSEAPENAIEFRRLLTSLRSSLVQGTDGARGKRIAVTSARPGDGGSYVSEHLAHEASAQVKLRVALLDMTRLLEATRSNHAVTVGLQRDETTLCWELAFPGSAVADSSLLILGQFGKQTFWTDLEPALQNADKHFDMIFLDCPSLRDSTLAIYLDGIVDGYVAVVAAAAARKRQIRQMVSFLQQTETPVLGYLLNRRTYPIPHWLYRVL